MSIDFFLHGMEWNSKQCDIAALPIFMRNDSGRDSKCCFRYRLPLFFLGFPPLPESLPRQPDVKRVEWTNYMWVWEIMAGGLTGATSSQTSDQGHGHVSPTQRPICIDWTDRHSADNSARRKLLYFALGHSRGSYQGASQFSTSRVWFTIPASL